MSTDDNTDREALAKVIHEARSLTPLGDGSPRLFGVAAPDAVLADAILVGLSSLGWAKADDTLEYGYNTGSTTTWIGGREQIEAWAAARGMKIGSGDWGSRIMSRRPAGLWFPAAPDTTKEPTP